MVDLSAATLPGELQWTLRHIVITTHFWFHNHELESLQSGLWGSPHPLEASVAVAKKPSVPGGSTIVAIALPPFHPLREQS